MFSPRVDRRRPLVSLPLASLGKKATQQCPCGYATDPTKHCQCNPLAVQRYRSRMSGPLLDRIDIHVEVPAVPVRELARRDAAGEPSVTIRARVNAARAIQQERYHDVPGVHCNAHLGTREMKKFCPLDDTSASTLERALNMLGLSARAYDRIIKVARTIADLAAAENIQVDHISEAINYRALDRHV
ncbi:magnesium chelatase [candidate division BRC1 bacterium HGW-BRC1-1]|nr:MAG: magnesium chelatase [candidate division BRC1 bacterium HGW-BRC1-1]